MKGICTFLSVTWLMIIFSGPALHAAEFTLFYSNDIRGETEPCG
jgi:hypothetical protein